MTTPNPKKDARPAHRNIDRPGRTEIWSPAQESLMQTLGSVMKIPSATGLLSMRDLFGTTPPYRMKRSYLDQLRERVLIGRVRCGDRLIDDFIDDVLSDDLTFESYFVVQDTRTAYQVHPLYRVFGVLTPFQAATEVAWSVSTSQAVLPEETSVMHAAGLFYPVGYFWCAHPNRKAKRHGCRANLEDVRRGRSLTLTKPLERLCEKLPVDGALLCALLLGWGAAEEARQAAKVDSEATQGHEQYARLLTELHLSSTRISHRWHSVVHWDHPNA
jgi:hypothetical protein